MRPGRARSPVKLVMHSAAYKLLRLSLGGASQRNGNQFLVVARINMTIGKGWM